MNLILQAQRDLAITLQDSARGFGWPAVFTDPDGATAAVTGSSNDISRSIDPDTGQLVSGRTITFTARISELADKGLGLPRGEEDTGLRPWLVTVADPATMTETTYKVAEADPDRTLGIVVCILENYTP